jgi:hypothetical protein
MKAHCIAHITAMQVIGICVASFQMTVILWHLLGTVIHQCKPKRMQEVRAAAMVLFSSLNNNKRMFEATIPTKQSQHE